MEDDSKDVLIGIVNGVAREVADDFGVDDDGQRYRVVLLVQIPNSEYIAVGSNVDLGEVSALLKRGVATVRARERVPRA